MTLVDRILMLMEQRNVTAAQLTRATGLAVSAVTEWKKGKGTPKADAILKLAQYFGVTTDYLLTGEERGRQTAAPLRSDQQELLYLYERLTDERKTRYMEVLRDATGTNSVAAPPERGQGTA